MKRPILWLFTNWWYRLSFKQSYGDNILHALHHHLLDGRRSIFIIFYFKFLFLLLKHVVSDEWLQDSWNACEPNNMSEAEMSNWWGIKRKAPPFLGLKWSFDLYYFLADRVERYCGVFKMQIMCSIAFPKTACGRPTLSTLFLRCNFMRMQS